MCQISLTLRIFPDKGVRKGSLTGFSKFKMAAAAMLDSGNQVFFGAIDELYSKSQHSRLI